MLLATVPLVSCRGSKPSVQNTDPSLAPVQPASSAALEPLAFVEDDYPKAIAAAKVSAKPLFVDVWATWCHTCMSMKEFVLPAPEMRALGSAFVWLAIDSEKAENADFLERFPTTALPTLWIIEPTSERSVLKWVGAATAPELVTLLEDAVSATRTDAALGEAGAAAVRGDQASAAGQLEEAATAYREALSKAPARWARRPRVVEALSQRLRDLERHAECVELAAREIPGLPPGTPLINVTVNALGAHEALAADDPARRHRSLLVREGTRVAEDGTQPVLIDDRSGLFLALVGALHEADPGEAKRLARSWANMLETAAGQAATSESRAVWDPHRLYAYIELGEVERALPMLEQSERDFPDDYNPPARLARAYHELRRSEAALAAATRALHRVHGPRKLRILMLKADIHLADGDRPAARRAIGEALELAGQLRLPANYQRLRQELARRFDELG